MVQTLKNIIAVIPSYKPDNRLIKVISDLKENGFTDILVVDDGSGEDFKDKFESAAKLGCTLLVHPQNRGKGAALKTAFSYICENRPECAGALTLDGDAQHLGKDALACALDMLSTGKIIFGCRNFSLPQVPKRNRMGNRITSFVMRAFCSVKLSDTQTGLRAVPSLYFKEMLETKGDRYEYETNMLLTIKRENIPFAERCIDTVYIGGNETSHFKPFRDSLRIYAFLFKFAFSSFSSFLLDELAFFILFYLLAQPLGIFAKAVCTVSARIISSVYNFSLNKRVVFRYSGSLKGAVLRYYAAAAVILATSTLFLYLSGLVFKTTPIVTTINKAIIDACLFFASYKVQQQWVFKDNRRR